jgi:hypothetical protein
VDDLLLHTLALAAGAQLFVHRRTSFQPGLGGSWRRLMAAALDERVKSTLAL